jgi:CRP/FNR family transcriptional regulator, cyclic AMP receptor protein
MMAPVERALIAEPAPGRVAASLLDLEPELAEGLPDGVAGAARARLAVGVHSLPVGRWDPDIIPLRMRSGLGVIVLDGLLSRSVTVGGGGALELLGAGDIVDPWTDRNDGMLAVGIEWAVLAPARIAILDPRVVATMCRWPEVVDAVMRRAGRRASRLAVHQAISQLSRVEQRILTLLWYLAERWGRVTASGVQVTLPLSHGALGGLVGARRPTVSLAVKELAGQKLVTRRDDGSWMLHGNPPANLARVRRIRRTPHDGAPAAHAPGSLAQRVVALRGRYEQNLVEAKDVLERSARTRKVARELVTRPPRRGPLAPPRPAPPE